MTCVLTIPRDSSQPMIAHSEICKNRFINCMSVQVDAGFIDLLYNIYGEWSVDIEKNSFTLETG